MDHPKCCEKVVSYWRKWSLTTELNGTTWGVFRPGHTPTHARKTYNSNSAMSSRKEVTRTLWCRVSLHYRRFMSQARRRRHFARSSKEARNECEARVEGRRKRKLYVSHPLVSRFVQNAAFALLSNKKHLLCWPKPPPQEMIAFAYEERFELQLTVSKMDSIRNRPQLSVLYYRGVRFIYFKKVTWHQ